MNRRTAFKVMAGFTSALAGALLVKPNAALARCNNEASFEGAGQSAATAPTGPFTLPALPYGYETLEPYFDAETMHLHHDKHHQAYVDKLNAAVAGKPELAKLDVFTLVTRLDGLEGATLAAVRNQGGGHANHSFLWTTLGKGGAEPKGELAKAIDAKFGSLASMQEKLTDAAVGVFGSGWAWLVSTPGGGPLSIMITPNQDSPLTVGYKPVLGIDVWEHAYYLKYKNKRPDYVKAYFSAVNWDAVSEQFAGLKKT